MKKLLTLLLILTILFFILTPLITVEARQGCCSHHGGVCGCHCCDGTSLSATCAPYYPQCSTKTTPQHEPPGSEYEPPASKNDLPASEKYTAEIPKESSGGSIWWWVIGIGVVGYLFYTFRKRKE